MGWIDRLLGKADETALPLYEAVVAVARSPHWYIEGAVPDTTDGRFDMIAAVLTIVLLRLEGEPAAAPLSASVTERFVDDMDAQLRQGGIGDIVVGKRIGKLMAMLGGRLGAYRDGLAADAPGGTLEAALVRNLYRGQEPAPAALAHVAGRLRALHAAAVATPVAALAEGALP